MPRTPPTTKALKVRARLGDLQELPGAELLAGGACFTATANGAGLAYTFPRGTLARFGWLSADLLAEGQDLPVFMLTLQEGAQGPAFHVTFGLLTHCEARLRVPLAAVDQRVWCLGRDAALLKLLCGGARVDLAKVDRATLVICKKTDPPLRFHLTSLTAHVAMPPHIEHPLLTHGPLLDELGQSRLHEWPAKTRSAEELVDRLREQHAAAPRLQAPADRNRWGGCAALKLGDATGVFRTHYDGQRWWLLDPDGCAFWSAGLDCVRCGVQSAVAGLHDALAWHPPADGRYAAAVRGQDSPHETIDYLVANFIRAFGPDEWHAAWAQTALGQMRQFGFNTVANWSDWPVARAAAFPYVRPLTPHFARTPMVFRDFPDVFDPRFAADCADYAKQLDETADDPAFIGYFLMNEPTWGFASETPAAGMLAVTPQAATRRALAEHLGRRYADSAALAAAWGAGASFDALAAGPWTLPLTDAARADLAAFSSVMVAKLFGDLSAACKQVDPRHLNLGARYYTVPPAWALAGMTCFDVFSVNGYSQRVRPELAELSAQTQRPVMIGEWHFGALDVGLPGSGIGRVRDQADRGRAFRRYTEDAAAQPWCVGVHYFTLYDESALGRCDGENWNIGFLDVCHRPYEPLVAAARASHERLYAVAQGRVPPFADAPEYLPLVFN